jgi:hypothetical protein
VAKVPRILGVCGLLDLCDAVSSTAGLPELGSPQLRDSVRAGARACDQVFAVRQHVGHVVDPLVLRGPRARLFLLIGTAIEITVKGPIERLVLQSVRAG